MCLKKCVGTANLSYNELHTMVTGIEAIMNSRPVTYLYSEEIEDPLTLSHLLCGRKLTSLPKFQPEKKEDRNFDEREEFYRKREQYLARVLRHFGLAGKLNIWLTYENIMPSEKRELAYP